MPDFQKVAAPVFTPTECSACMSHADPEGFVDLLAEFNPPYGRLYLCAKCTKQAGRQMGMIDADQSRVLRERLAAAVTENTELKGALEAEKQNKLISLKDAKKLLVADL